MAPETGHNDEEANQKTVFIDTSLDTHLATIVSDSDTVSDLKKKIILEHQECFPAIGDIKIHCLKVKRRGNFYHLSDSLLVKNAFGDANKNWFVSVDASCIEQDGEIQRVGKPNAGDQLALPWATDSRSIDRHDSHEDRPSKLSLVDGLPSMHPKIVPFVNQGVPSVDQLTSGESCKDVSKNMEEDRSSNDDHWRNPKPVSEKCDTVNKDMKSKKRIRNAHNEGSLVEALESWPSVKKKRKTQGIEGTIKASEGERVLTSKSKDVTLDVVATEPLSEDHTRTISVSQKKKKKTNKINKGNDNSAHDQLGTAVPFSVEDVGEETLLQKNTEASEFMLDVAMIEEKNIQQEMPIGTSQKEKCNELVQKAVSGNEIPSSSMRTSDCEHDAPEVTSVVNLEGGKCSTKRKAVEKEVSSTPLVKKLLNTSKDTIDSSEQDIGFTSKEFAGDQIDKHEVPSKETTGCENTGGGKRKKAKKPAKNKEEPLVKHVGDIPSSVPNPVFDDKIVEERKNDEINLSRADKNEVSDKRLIDDSLVYASQKGDDSIVKEAEVSEPTENNRSQVHAEDVEGKARKEFKDILGSKRKKKDVKKPASRTKEPVVKHADNYTTEANEGNLLSHFEKKESQETTSIDVLHVDGGRNDDKPVDNEVDISIIETNRRQVNGENMNDMSGKENEKADGTKKTKKNKKIRKSASRNEEDKSSLPDASKASIEAGGKVEGKDAEFSPVSEANGNEEGVDGKLRNKQNPTSQSFSVVPIKEHGSGVDCFQPNKLEKAQDAQNLDVGLVKKAKKNNKSSLKGSKRQPLPEETSKNEAVLEVSKVRTEGKDDVDTPKDGSREIDFKQYFVPGQQTNEIASVDNLKDTKTSVGEKKPKKKTKELPLIVDPLRNQTDSRNAGAALSRKSLSKNGNNRDGVKESNCSNIDQIKTPKKTLKTDPPRTTKSAHGNKGGDGPSSESSSSSEASGRVQIHVRTSKKSVPFVNSTQKVKNLLNAPGAIFGDDRDESSGDDNATVDSDGSTRTPSLKSSSSGESDSSIDSKRHGSNAAKRTDASGKNNMNSQMKSKNVSMADLLRSSSRFRKAKITASQQMDDTESQPVDFVPESQPEAKW